jgi:hypothetical protein
MSIEKIEERLIAIERMLSGIIQNQKQKPEITHLRTKDACEYLSVSENTLMKICVHNNIYPVKISGLNYFSLSDLQALFK